MSTVNYRPIMRAERVPVVAPLTTTAQIAAFSLTNDESSVSTILAEYPLLNAENITLGIPLNRDFKKYNTFFVAVRFLNANNDIVRYVLHRPNEDVNLFFPDYASQPIGAAAILEIWANPTDTIVSTNGKVLSIVINDYTYYTGNDTRYIPTMTAPTITLTPTVFVATPSGPSNPFADNAELTQ